MQVMIKTYSGLASERAEEIIQECDKGIKTAWDLYSVMNVLAHFHEYVGMLDAYDSEAGWRGFQVGMALRRMIRESAYDLLGP